MRHEIQIQKSKSKIAINYFVCLFVACVRLGSMQKQSVKMTVTHVGFQQFNVPFIESCEMKQINIFDLD